MDSGSAIVYLVLRIRIAEALAYMPNVCHINMYSNYVCISDELSRRECYHRGWIKLENM